MNNFIYLVYIIVLTCSYGYEYTNPNQYNALKALYDATNGDSWNWNDGIRYGYPWNFTNEESDPCTNYWQGILCDVYECGAGECMVINLNLTGTNLNGTLPPEFTNLNAIRSLELTRNSLYGTLPDTMYNMSALQYIAFSYNKFSGTIPSTFGSTSEYLEAIFFNNNHFEGTIPFSLMNNTFLDTLYLSNNMLTGSLPSMLCDIARNLSFVSFDYNYFTGTIPQHIYHTCTDMAYFSIIDNSIEGVIDDGLYNLTDLYQLALAENFLSGTLSNRISQLGGLIVVRLEYNFFTGTVPSDGFRYFSVLQSLFLQGNSFSGTVSASLFGGNSTNATTDIRHIDISDNIFSGSIPIAIFQIPSLVTFAATKNCFTGEFSNDICNYVSTSNLEVLVLDGLTSADKCAVKSVLSNLPFITPVLVKYMSGTIPHCIYDIPYIQVLHVSGNGLGGKVVTSLPNSSQLSDLALSYNQLTGTISEMIQKWEFSSLDLSYNQIRGDLDHMTHSNNTNVSISLVENRLSGLVPSPLLPLTSINILEGNLFACPKHDDLPDHDPSRSTYSCGSQEYSHSMILLIIIAGAVGLILVLNLNYSYYFDTKSRLYRYKQQARSNSKANSLSGIAMNNSAFPRFSLSHVGDDSESMNTKRVSDNGAEPGEHGTAITKHSLLDSFQHWLFGMGHHCYRTLSNLIYDLIHIRSIYRGYLVYLQYWSKYNLQLPASRQSVRIDATKGDDALQVDAPNMYRFVYLLRAFRRLSVVIMLYAVCVCLPVYGILYEAPGADYGTHDHLYLWITTAGFFSGIVPGIVLLVMWSMCMCLLYMCVITVHQKLLSVANSSGINILLTTWNTLKVNMRSLGSVDSESSSIKSDIKNEAVENPILSCGYEKDSTSSEDSIDVVASTPSTSASWKEEGSSDSSVTRTKDRNEQIPSKCNWTSAPVLHHIRVVLSATVFVVFDVICAMVVNGFYVAAIQSNKYNEAQKMLVQMALAVFKLVWNQWVVRVAMGYIRNPTKIRLPRSKRWVGDSGGEGWTGENSYKARRARLLLRRTASTTPTTSSEASTSYSEEDADVATNQEEATKNSKRNMRLHVSILVFNLLVAPCLATFFTDSSCFYNYFVPSPPVKSSYTFNYCDIAYAIYGGQIVCGHTSTPTFVTSYVPPFVYNYACASSIISSYLPVFMFTYSFVFLFTPIAYAIGCFGKKRLFPTFMFVRMDAIMRPHNEISTEFNHLIKADGIVALQIQHLVTLLTFGVVCPILAILICMAICSTTLVWQFLIVRYVNYYHYKEFFDPSKEDHVNVALSHGGSVSATTISKTAIENVPIGTTHENDAHCNSGSMKLHDSESEGMQRNADNESDDNVECDEDREEEEYDSLHLFVSLEAPQNDYRNSNVSPASLSDDDRGLKSIQNDRGSVRNRPTAYMLMSATEAEEGVDIECGHAWMGLKESVFVLLIVACVFYACILFDVIANANTASYDAASVMCTVCIFVPLLLWIVYRFKHNS